MTGSGMELPGPIVEWIGEVTGAGVERTDRRPGGARKEAWFVDVRRPGGDLAELFLRYDRSDPSSTGDPWTLHREASVYLALQDTGVPVPRVVAVHPREQAMLTVRVAGENWFSRIQDPDEALATAQDFMTKLAALHRIDVRRLDLPFFPEPTSVQDLVHHELDEWERCLEHRGGDPDPALRFSLDWLRAHVPAYDGPIVLVQGDTGPGNFMYAHGRVVAVVDWELAHLGDPMDDIAWLSLRAVQEPFTHFPDRLAEYAELSGHPIDEDRVHYYQVMAETKLLVMGHRPGNGVASRAGGADVGNGLIYGMLHRRLWLEAMNELIGLEEQHAEDAPTAEAAETDWLFEHVLTELREVVVPRISDPLALQRTKGLARILKYLAEIQRHGAFYEQCELADIGDALGTRPDSLNEGRVAMADAVRLGALGHESYLRYLGRRFARENELMRSASGALADRRWPPLH
jgi:aminoglycoside phosphotransferase (APT) family kinase protein